MARRCVVAWWGGKIKITAKAVYGSNNSSVVSYNVCFANYHTIKDCYHLNKVNYHDKFAKAK